MWELLSGGPAVAVRDGREGERREDKQTGGRGGGGEVRGQIDGREGQGDRLERNA